MNRIEILKKTKLFVLDMDGTFYLGEHVLDGALDFISSVKKAGKDCRRDTKADWSLRRSGRRIA